MSQDLLPRKARTFQASEQSLFGGSRTSDTCLHSIAQFLHVMRCKTGCVLADLGPHELDRIQLRSTGWEPINMETWMVVGELLCLRRDMNFVAIPDKNNGTGYQFQHLLQENDGVLRTQVTQKGAYTQADLSQFRTDEQGAKQIQALVMVQARACCRRSSTWRPTPFERRHQRETRFIYYHQGRLQSSPLFLVLGQTRRFQLVIASSLRWIASRWTFWQLQPIPFKRRHTPLAV